MNPTSAHSVQHVADAPGTNRPAMADPPPPPPPTPPPPVGLRRAALENAILAVAYAVAGKLALALAIAPGFATAVFPPAGIALAAVLAFGYRMLPGVLLGSFLMNLPTAFDADSGAALARSVWVPLSIGLGATLQAAVGAAAVRRLNGAPLLLVRERDIIGSLVLAGPVACVISATCGVAALMASGLLPAASAPISWSTWWVGDTTGAVIFAPMLLPFLARPRPVWRPRRLQVSLPLAIVFTLALILFLRASGWERDRAADDFTNRAQVLATLVDHRVQLDLGALEDCQGLMAITDELSRERFRTFVAGPLRRHPELRALSWIPVIPHDRRAAFEQTLRREWFTEHTIKEPGAGHGFKPAAERDVYYPVRFTEPFAENATSVGFDLGSETARAASLFAARDSGLPVATGPITLLVPEAPLGFAIHLPIYRPDAAAGSVAERRQNLRGFVGAVFLVERLIDVALEGVDREGIEFSLIDDTDPARPLPLFTTAAAATAGAAAQRASDGGRRAARYQLTGSFPMTVAGHRLRLDAVKPAAYLLAHPTWTAWLVLVRSLVFSGMFGGFLLVLTGRNARTQDIVEERTRELSETNARLATEVRERQAVEQNLRQARRFAESVADHTAAIIYVFDVASGTNAYSNRNVAEFLGYAADYIERMGSSLLATIIHPDDLPNLLARRAALAGAPDGQVLECQNRCRHVSGGWRWMLVREVVFRRGPDGAPQQFLGIAQDITELRATQEELSHARDAAEAANQAKGAFLANISHEIRTPLNAVIGYANLLLDRAGRNLDPEQCLRTIRRNAAHLLELLNDVLDFSKIESGQVAVVREPVDLHDLAEQVTQTVRPEALEKGLDFAFESQCPAPLRVMSDGLRLRQILLNLVGNAVKFTPAGSVRLTLAAAPTGQPDVSDVRFTVADSGIGLSEEQIAALFRPFAQADASTTRRFGGTGLGLAISKRLADALGATIEVAAATGRGSVFTLRLPRVELAPEGVAPDTKGPPRASRPDRAQARRRRLRGRVLLAEDGRDNQRLIAAILADAGLDVELAVDGREAVNAAADTEFDLILMDVQMPVLDGYAATAQILARRPGARVVAITAHATTRDRDRCLAAGCIDYLTKPIEPDALIAALARYLPAASAEAPANTPLRSTLASNPRRQQVLRQYVEDLPGDVARLEEMLAREDLAGLTTFVHQIKGSGGAYGFPRITELAADAERPLVEGTLDRARPEIQRLIECIRSVEGYNDSGAVGAAPPQE